MAGRPDVRRGQSAEQDADQGGDVGGGADGGAGVRAHALLVDDDRRGEVLEHVDVGTRQARHKALDEGAVGFVDQAAGLGGHSAEDQGGLARSGDSGEYGETSFRDVDVDVLQVVGAGTTDVDGVVGVGGRNGQVVGGVSTHSSRYTGRCSLVRAVVRATVDVDVLQVVGAGAADVDGVVAV